MAIDPSIIFQLQQYKAPDQMQGMQQAMTIGNLMQQAQMGRLQMQQHEQAMADDQAVRQAYQSAGGDEAKIGETLRQSGQYKAYQAFQKSLQERAKEKAATDKSLMDTRGKAFEIQRGLTASLALNPTDENVVGLAKQFVSNKLLDEASATQFASRLLSLPPDQRRREVFALSQSPEGVMKMLTPNVKMQDIGGSVVPVDENYWTNPNQQALTKTQTPDSVASGQIQIRGQDLSNQLGWANNKISAGQLGVAQANSAETRRHNMYNEQNPIANIQDSGAGLVGVNPRTLQSQPVKGSDGVQVPSKMGEGAKKELSAVENNIAQAKAALKTIEENPDAFGIGVGLLSKATGGMSVSAMKPQNQEARAFIMAKGAAMANDLYGAAQSAAEMARAKSFVPQDTDTPQQLVSKFRAMTKEYEIKFGVIKGGKPAAAPAATPDNDPLGLRR